MNKTKRFFAVIFALIMTFSSFAICANADENTKELKFKDGKFKILVLADVQDTDKPQQETVDLMTNAIDKTQPDLIVLTGDNIAGWWRNVTPEKTKKAVENVAKTINDRKIPFALVFGNHDHEGLSDEVNQMEEAEAKELVLSWFKEYEYCLAAEGEEMTGLANYNLTVKDSVGEKDIFNMWFMDSNTYSDESEGGGYGYVHKDQIEWYESKSNELKEANGGKPLPSLVFQHIAVPETYEMFNEVPKGTKGAIRGNAGYTKQYYVENPDYVLQGELNEGPCSANTANDGQFDSWVKQGDVIGAVFGHDHINTYTGELEGIKLMATPGVTFHAYGNNRGVRTITLNESNLNDFETEVLLFSDLVDYEVKNIFIREFGYETYRRKIIPAIIGISVGLVVIAATVTVTVKVVKKKKSEKNK